MLYYTYNGGMHVEESRLGKDLTVSLIKWYTMYIMEKEMNNGIIGTHLATNQPVELELTPQEMELGLYKTVTGEEKWNTMCDMVLARTGIEIIGQIEIDYMVVDGYKHVFH